MSRVSFEAGLEDLEVWELDSLSGDTEIDLIEINNQTIIIDEASQLQLRAINFQRLPYADTVLEISNVENEEFVFEPTASVNLRSHSLLNLVSQEIEGYFTVENDLSETAISNLQHSNGCFCSACSGDRFNSLENNANQEIENVAAFNAGNGKWFQPGGLGSQVTITYSYINLLDGGLNGISAGEAEAALEEAFSLWSSVAPLNFVEVEDSSGTSQIRIGHDFIDGVNNTLAFAFFPTNGDITFDNGENWNTSLFLETALHEIGHSLGLGHEENVDAILNPTIQNRFSGLGSGFLLPDDVNGIRSIYGIGSGSVSPLGAIDNSTPSSEFNGTNGNDTLIGNDEANTILGFGGNDYLEGRFGLDIIDGGAGNDTVSYSYSSSGFTWDLNTDQLIFNSGGSETVRNVENVVGSQGNDRIVGNNANNIFEGAGGADTFVFASLDSSIDTIRDFSLGEGDRIEVSRSGFGFGTGDEFTYNSSSGGLFFNGQQFAILENLPSLSDINAGFIIS